MSLPSPPPSPQAGVPSAASSEDAAEECPITVAVNIRPLLVDEIADGCRACFEAQDRDDDAGDKAKAKASSEDATTRRSKARRHAGLVVDKGRYCFNYDYVYGPSAAGGRSSSRLFDDCVAPYVHGLFSGYNATILAYGQTGSGKTYTMGGLESAHGGAASSDAPSSGAPKAVIPQVMDTLWDRIAQEAKSEGGAEITARVSYVELYQEEIRDLLVIHPIKPSDGGEEAGERATARAPTQAPVPSSGGVTIREAASGEVCLMGAKEVDVHNREEMAACFEQGALCRATSATGMNRHSSRSHAIFTIQITSRRASEETVPTGEDTNHAEGGREEGGKEASPKAFLTAKMHLVDLAGSERAKRTKATGDVLKEGIHINRGLLALGNVISVLGDEQRRGGHVPYRDSKLTRLLQVRRGERPRRPSHPSLPSFPPIHTRMQTRMDIPQASGPTLPAA